MDHLHLPEGYSLSGKPVHHVGEDCMGGSVNNWSQSAIGPDQRLRFGYGMTPETAFQVLAAKCHEEVTLGNLSPRERLAKVMATAKARTVPRLYDSELFGVIEDICMLLGV